MKKLLLLSILFISCKNQSQEILFEVAYKPNLVYKQSMEQTSNNETTYLGPKELIKKLEEKKLENPQITLNKTFMENVNSTGNLENDRFPLTIKFIGKKKINNTKWHVIIWLCSSKS